MSTIKQIAQLAGVSRGTVDRVLNNRGSVHPQTELKVREIAKAIDYSPNLAGKTLAVKKKQLKFGYILFSSTASNPFFEDVVRGIHSRAGELAEFGVSVEVRFATINNPVLQAELIDELLSLGIDGLVIVPISHPTVVEKIAALTASGFPVVTANSDIPDCGRLAFVGSNFYKSGETSAGLLRLLTRGPVNVGVIIGSPWVLCHSERVAGFTDYAAAHFPDFRLVDRAVNNDDDLDSFSVTKAMLSAHPDINALFLAAAGVYGACRAVMDLGLAGSLTIISYDTVETTCQLVRDGVIAATIAQQPFTQGAKPLDILFDFLGMGIKPEKEFFYTKIEIRIKENI